MKPSQHATKGAYTTTELLQDNTRHRQGRKLLHVVMLLPLAYRCLNSRRALLAAFPLPFRFLLDRTSPSFALHRALGRTSNCHSSSVAPFRKATSNAEVGSMSCTVR